MLMGVDMQRVFLTSTCTAFSYAMVLGCRVLRKHRSSLRPSVSCLCNWHGAFWRTLTAFKAGTKTAWINVHTHINLSVLQLYILPVQWQSYISTSQRSWDSNLNNICEVHRNVFISSKGHTEINNYLLNTGLAQNVQQTKGIEHWRLVIKEKKYGHFLTISCTEAVISRWKN